MLGSLSDIFRINLNRSPMRGRRSYCYGSNEENEQS